MIQTRRAAKRSVAAWNPECTSPSVKRYRSNTTFAGNGPCPLLTFDIGSVAVIPWAEEDKVNNQGNNGVSGQAIPLSTTERPPVYSRAGSESNLKTTYL
jgi:hypothetical protein